MAEIQLEHNESNKKEIKELEDRNEKLQKQIESLTEDLKEFENKKVSFLFKKF